MPTVKLAANVPTKVKAKYMDLVPGEYGSQVRIKGAIGEEEGVLYTPGKIRDVLTTLAAAGIIPTFDGELEPDKPVDLSPKKKEFTLVLHQPAGQKYGELQVMGVPRAAAPSSNGNGSHAVSAGGPSRPQKPHAVLYDQCLQYASKQVPLRLKEAGLVATSEDVLRGAATLFIAASKSDGTVFAAPKPAPAPPPPPPPPPPADDFDPRSLEDSDDGLPF